MTSTRHEKMKPSKKDDRTFPYQHSRSENSSPHSSPTTSRCVDRIQTRAKDGILREALLLTTTGNHPPPKQFDDDEHAFSSDEHDSNAEVDWEDKDRANTAVQLAENHDKDDDDDSTYHETTTSETSTTATTASSHSSNASTTTTTVIVVPPPPQPSLLTRFCQKTFGGRGKRKRGNTAGDDGAAWGVVDFTVKASPPQCLGLIEGICRHDVVSTNDSGNPSSSNNYYTSQRYHYLTDLCLSGRSELLPTTGRAWELLSAPLAPGRWIAKIAATCHGDHDPTTEATTARLQELQRLQRDKQADWHGQCIRLVHEDYQLTLAQPTKQRGKVRGFHTTRVDPAANRVEMLQNQGIETQDDSSAVFVGLIAIAAFDGFATKTDSSCLASALVQTVLCAMRDRWSVDRALCRVEKFTAHGDVKGEYRTKSVSGSGGVAVAVNIDLNSTAHSDGYYLQLITCEVTNQVVAVEGKLQDTIIVRHISHSHRLLITCLARRISYLFETRALEFRIEHGIDEQYRAFDTAEFRPAHIVAGC